MLHLTLQLRNKNVTSKHHKIHNLKSTFYNFSKAMSQPSVCSSETACACSAYSDYAAKFKRHVAQRVMLMVIVTISEKRKATSFWLFSYLELTTVV